MRWLCQSRTCRGKLWRNVPPRGCAHAHAGGDDGAPRGCGCARGRAGAPRDCDCDLVCGCGFVRGGLWVCAARKSWGVPYKNEWVASGDEQRTRCGGRMRGVLFRVCPGRHNAEEGPAVKRSAAGGTLSYRKRKACVLGLGDCPLGPGEKRSAARCVGRKPLAVAMLNIFCAVKTPCPVPVGYFQ